MDRISLSMNILRKHFSFMGQKQQQKIPRNVLNFDDNIFVVHFHGPWTRLLDIY